MTDENDRDTLGAMIGRHIGAIVSAIIMGLLSYVIGTTRTGMTIDQMGHRLDSAENRLSEADAYHRCVTRHIDRIETHAGAPSCDLGDKE